jgi:hypothetical protein
MSQYPAPPPPPPPPPGSPLNYAAPPPAGRTDLREIAVRQRMIMICILSYLLLVVAQFVVPPPLRIVLGLVALGVTITATVFVFMLSLALYGTAAGIVLGLLTLIPLIGLIVLLIVNGKATNILREHGIRVGLLGANPNQIPSRGTQY